MSWMRRTFLIAATACAASAAVAAPADEAVVLTVKRATAETVQLTMKQLLALPQHSFSARTPWYKDSVVFTGPLLRDVLKLAGVVSGTELQATALDEYRISIPFEDAQRFQVIAATQINGQTLTRRDKGPLFIVYPFDSAPELQSVRYYERSIWQLKALDVK